MNKVLIAGAIALTLATTGVWAADPGRTSTTDKTGVMSSMSKVRASDLIGTNIVNDQNETIGEVEDLVIDSNKNIIAIVSVGGFLGVGEKRVAVPYEQLRISPDRDKVKVLYSATKDQLKDAPAYDYRDDALTR